MACLPQSTTPPGVDVTLTPEERTPCEVWSRVMGYHRPVASWNIGKRAEHGDRKFFNTERTAAQLN